MHACSSLLKTAASPPCSRECGAVCRVTPAVVTRSKAPQAAITACCAAAPPRPCPPPPRSNQQPALPPLWWGGGGATCAPSNAFIPTQHPRPAHPLPPSCLAPSCQMTAGGRWCQSRSPSPSCCWASRSAVCRSRSPSGAHACVCVTRVTADVERGVDGAEKALCWGCCWSQRPELAHCMLPEPRSSLCPSSSQPLSSLPFRPR